VYSRADEEIGRLMSNFAHTPFVLDGVAYGSVESFYVSLLFLDPAKRHKLAPLYGGVVKRMGMKSRLKVTRYGDAEFALGSDAHVALIKRAIRAKLEAHPKIACAFVATAPRPIVHDTGVPDRPDAEFPAPVFCRILTELRDEFAARLAREGIGSTEIETKQDVKEL